MSETAFSSSQLESPAPGATLPQGKHRLKGWVWPKPGGHFVDVRARFGQRIFPGCHGFPRADLAAHFRTGHRHALAEFQIVVTLPPGPVELVLEVLAIDGRWHVFATAGYLVTPHQPPVDMAEPSGAVRWLDFSRGLQRLLRDVAQHPEKSPAALASALIAELPYPRDLLHPPGPMRGFVDQPAMVACARFGRLPAFGHLFHPDIPMRRVLGTVDLQTWQPLTYGQPSPGPAAFYQTAHAHNCGFANLVDVPAQLPNPLSLRIYAELADDSLHLCHVVRTRVHPLEEEKRPYPVRTPGRFDEVLAAWNAALATHGLTVERNADLELALTRLREEYSLRASSRPIPPAALLIETPSPTGAPAPKRVLLATHGLSLQGAPRFLLDYARHLVTAGVQVSVVSAEDGPLRAEYAAFGVEVAVLDTTAVFSAPTLDTARAAITSLSRTFDWASTHLVVANSFTTFWAVHAAKATGRPVLLYVHESTTPAAFYEQRVPPPVIALAEEAFGLADAVSFTTASTRSYHLDDARTWHHRLTPGWIDVARLDRWLANQDRAALRQKFGVSPDELLVCNIGTVSDRKGQHTFVRAVDLFRRRHPDLTARCRFILLGGRDTDFDRMLSEVLQELALPNLAVHPETSDYLPYYHAADLFVCSSYEESSPRVVLEAMACRVPILATAVQGIPELVRPGLEAVLLPAGHTLAWADMLAQLLADPARLTTLTKNARARIESTFAASAVLPRHLELAAEVAAGMITEQSSAPVSAPAPISPPPSPASLAAVVPAEQHNIEIALNRASWEKKPLLRKIYRGFYEAIATCLRPELPGSIVELGSGMGNIKDVIPGCITTDLFPNPWLDRQENAYALRFPAGSVSNLVLFDVWHHLAHPQTALREFARVVAPGGRLVLFEPGMGWLGQLVYGLFHHEPLGWRHKFVHAAPAGFVPDDAPYFAAQASATRLFLREKPAYLDEHWRVVQTRQLAAVAYVASGGFSKPQLYPTGWLPLLRSVDTILSLLPYLFATRLLIVLERRPVTPP